MALLRKVGHNLAERRPRAILDRGGRPADVNEAGDTFIFSQAERLAKAGVIGHPFGEPSRRETEGAGGDNQIHAHGARGQNLLPFGNFLVWRCARAPSSRAGLSPRRISSASRLARSRAWPAKTRNRQGASLP